MANIKLKQFDKDIKESDIENYLVRKVKRLGGTAEKFKTPGRRSAPDRLLCFICGRAVFVECKAPGKKPTEKQYADHGRRRALGFKVYVVDTKEKVDKLLRILKRDLELQ